MKKLIAILLVLSCIVAFASCGKNEEDDGKALETAETYVEITDNIGSFSLNEDVVITLLEVYSKESLGLSKDIYEYSFKLSATRFLNKDACLAEAFFENAETPEGTFIILGQKCFVYNKKTQEYLLLTVDGAIEFDTSSIAQSEESITKNDNDFVYNKSNNEKLQEKFSSYTQKQLGLKKELSEYILVVPGTSTTADNGETVYVIRLYEKNGEVTNNTLAFNENGNYVFDLDLNRYVKL